MLTEIELQIYPRKIWIATDPSDFEGKFEYYIDANYKNTVDSEDEMKEAIYDGTYNACVHAVKRIDDGAYGVLIVLNLTEELTVNTFAHESVHVADLIFDSLNMCTESYEDGNEPYAYLVGFVASKLEETYKMETNDGRGK